MSQTCQVVVPVPVNKVFHYTVPDELVADVKPGKRLEVPFGPRTLVGYCVGLEPPEDVALSRLKPIQKVLDEEPLLSAKLLELTRWMSRHYLCPWVEALQTALPAPTRSGSRRAQTTYVRLKREPNEKEAEALQKRTPKQAYLIELLKESGGDIKRQDLLKQARASASSLNALVKKDLIALIKEDKLEDPLQNIDAVTETPPDLQEDQQKVWQEYVKDPTGVFLLRGVTGSGKTEIYFRAIDDVIQKNCQAIVLVPEISLTPQTLRRFASRFNNLAVLHSNLTDAQRAEQWSRIFRGEADVIVGARSALFAPTQKLGLIVIDEEHDSSFKQQNVPRYQARDVAIMRGHLENVPVILGSATPQLESWYNVKRKKSKLLHLPRRISNLPLPPVSVLDMSLEIDKDGREPIFANKTLRLIEQVVSQGQQAMLLLNRRGFSPALRCPRCTHVARCPSCDIALTAHKNLGRMVCHYCQHTTDIPQVCEQCKGPKPLAVGAGTERAHEALNKIYPDLRLLRMDADTTRARGSHQAILDAFRKHEADVLLGTQMISKGHDFPNVSLVVILNADVGLTLPDFRASERTFQLITQMAGRAGRAGDNGRVLVQTFLPRHYAIEAAARHDVDNFIEKELSVREPFRYPPFGRLARVLVSGSREEDVAGLAMTCRQQMTTSKPIDILGPAPCPLSKIDERYRYHILLKAPGHEPLHDALETLAFSPPSRRDTRLSLDIDPVSLL